MVGDFSDLPTFNYGHTLAHSSSRDFLNKMKAAWGYEWLLDHNRVVIIRNGASRPITHQLSASNGMEGVPKWNQQDMEVDVRLNTIIQPCDRVHITSDFWTINYTGTQQRNFRPRRWRIPRRAVSACYRPRIKGIIGITTGKRQFAANGGVHDEQF